MALTPVSDARGEDRKRDVRGIGVVLAQRRRVFQFFSAEVGRGNAEHDQAFGAVGFLQIVQRRDLVVEHGLAGEVDDQQQLAFVSGKRNDLAVEIDQREVVDSLFFAGFSSASARKRRKDRRQTAARTNGDASTAPVIDGIR